MRWLFLLALMSLLSSCDFYMVNPHRQHVSYLSEKGTISPPEFKPCFEEFTFPNFYSRQPAEFAPGRDSLRTYFYEAFDNGGIINDSGYVTIRFMINCRAETGRFEVLPIGLDYKEKQFNKKIIDQLLTLTMNLKDWSPYGRDYTSFDSSTHVTFKIVNGELVDILL